VAAATHAQAAHWRTTSLDIVLMASDGAATGIDRYRSYPDWNVAIATARVDPARLLSAIQHAESTDPAMARWPRSKPHDDKIVAVIDFVR